MEILNSAYEKKFHHRGGPKSLSLIINSVRIFARPHAHTYSSLYLPIHCRPDEKQSKRGLRVDEDMDEYIGCGDERQKGRTERGRR